MFNSFKDVYGAEGISLKAELKNKEEVKLDKDGNPEGPMHDRAFRPGGLIGPKKKLYPTIDKFPEYQPNPPTELKRKFPVEGAEDIPKFKLTYNKKTRPCMSVATNYRNLKSAYPSSFMK